MYLLKNAWRNTIRSLGRNLLIGLIVLVISCAACIGLSIRQATEQAKQETLSNLTITASISFDRRSMMQQMQPGSDGTFDKSQFREQMQNRQSLTLSDYEYYAGAESVSDFYYTQTVSVNGSDTFLPVSEEESETEENPEPADGMQNGGRGGMMSSADFRLIGYSSEMAMTSFQNGTAKITDGEIFALDDAASGCLISSELAAFNNLNVGDEIIVTNPQAETETYTLSICGIYSSEEAGNEMFMGNFGGNDPVNEIYMSDASLASILEQSTSLAESEGTEAVTSTISATYAFSSVEDYEVFAEEVYEMGLEETYLVSSADMNAFENSLTPLETLSTIAGSFLLVLFAISAVILVILNIFNVRERKYEIGVLTAIGVKKGKVAIQFLIETFLITFLAVAIGAAAGGVASVPVANYLLEGQIEAQSAQQEQLEMNFGRGGRMDMDKPDSVPSERNYISQIDSAMNLTVVLQMAGIAVLLTLTGAFVSMIFVMRYEPLKILANRD